MKRIMISLLIFLNSIFAFGISGKVVKVSDGDSFYLKLGKTVYRIRMYGIDAPELYQEHGDESKAYLEKIILNKNINVKVMDEDKYGRKIGKIFYKNKDVNLQMLESGNAWLYEYYAKGEKKYKKAFEKARKEKIGIWKYNNLENPRQYRLKHKREA
ncbi:thermonuclease family protein [Fusobacterium sp.]|uniref:thermonuclease family protein n=1 Tax=Fusobacterium sp. TaxID=68766 RepID=UPI00396C2FBA